MDDNNATTAAPTHIDDDDDNDNLLINRENIDPGVNTDAKKPPPLSSAVDLADLLLTDEKPPHHELLLDVQQQDYLSSATSQLDQNTQRRLSLELKNNELDLSESSKPLELEKPLVTPFLGSHDDLSPLTNFDADSNINVESLKQQQQQTDLQHSNLETKILSAVKSSDSLLTDEKPPQLLDDQQDQFNENNNYNQNIHRHLSLELKNEDLSEGSKPLESEKPLVTPFMGSHDDLSPMANFVAENIINSVKHQDNNYHQQSVLKKQSSSTESDLLLSDEKQPQLLDLSTSDMLMSPIKTHGLNNGGLNVDNLSSLDHVNDIHDDDGDDDDDDLLVSEPLGVDKEKRNTTDSEKPKVNSDVASPEDLSPIANFVADNLINSVISNLHDSDVLNETTVPLRSLEISKFSNDSLEVIEDDEPLETTQKQSSIELEKSPATVDETPIETRENPVELKESSTEVKECAIKEIESPIKVKESPIEVKESQIEVKESQIEVKESPIEVKETTVEVRESPIEMKETTVEVTESPVKAQETPVGSRESLSEVNEYPIESKESPIEVRETPIRLEESLFEVSEHPVELRKSSDGSEENPVESRQFHNVLEEFPTTDHNPRPTLLEELGTEDLTERNERIGMDEPPCLVSPKKKETLSHQLRQTKYSNTDVSDVLHWRDPIITGTIFAFGLSLILSTLFFSIISVIAYHALAIMMISLALRLYRSVMQTLNKKTPIDDIFERYLAKDVTLSTEKTHEMVDIALVHINDSLIKLRNVLLLEDKMGALKFGAILYPLLYVGSWFNGITLVFITYLALFSVPKVYELYKPEIDQYLNILGVHASTTMSSVMGKVSSIATSAAQSAASSTGIGLEQKEKSQ